MAAKPDRPSQSLISQIAAGASQNTLVLRHVSRSDRAQLESNQGGRANGRERNKRQISAASWGEVCKFDSFSGRSLVGCGSSE